MMLYWGGKAQSEGWVDDDDEQNRRFEPKSLEKRAKTSI